MKQASSMNKIIRILFLGESFLRLLAALDIILI